MLNLMSLDEVAKELKLSIHTVRAWSFQKRFPIVKLGRRVLVERECLERFVRGNVIEAKERT
jgi:excisionase family DNA binding protein